MDVLLERSATRACSPASAGCLESTKPVRVQALRLSYYSPTRRLHTCANAARTSSIHVLSSYFPLNARIASFWKTSLRPHQPRASRLCAPRSHLFIALLPADTRAVLLLSRPDTCRAPFLSFVGVCRYSHLFPSLHSRNNDIGIIKLVPVPLYIGLGISPSQEDSSMICDSSLT
jgi:hypothetical protein